MWERLTQIQEPAVGENKKQAPRGGIKEGKTMRKFTYLEMYGRQEEKNSFPINR